MSYTDRRQRAKREAYIKAAQGRLKDKICTKCSNNREPISLDDIKDDDPDLFMFEQDGACYCFFVYNLYYYVFGTKTIKPRNKMRILRAKNPLTNDRIGDDTILRLYRQYTKWYRSKGRGNTIVVNGVKLTDAMIEQFSQGMETMENMMRSQGAKPTSRQVAHAYASDSIDLADLDDDDPEDKIRIIKALYKNHTGEDFVE